MRVFVIVLSSSDATNGSEGTPCICVESMSIFIMHVCTHIQ